MSTELTTTLASERFELAQRQAKAIASSDLVPKAYKGNLANCLIAMELADRLGIHWLAVMQNLVIIHGKPSWQSQFVISLLNQSGRFGTLRYIYVGTPGGDDWGCYVSTVERETGEVIEGPPVTIGMAKADGWYHKDGSKWKSIPQLMLMYRAAAFFCRVYCPELTIGALTTDEVLDVQPTSPAPKTLGDLVAKHENQIDIVV